MLFTMANQEASSLGRAGPQQQQRFMQGLRQQLEDGKQPVGTGASIAIGYWPA
jgi:hypothetical protein